MISVEYCFEDIGSYIISKLESARHKILICVAWINIDIYGPVIKRKAQQGVLVEILYNDDFRNKRMFSYDLSPANTFPINTFRYGTYMHNKFCIIDDETVMTGSYNWSKNARFSFENITSITGDFNLVKGYLNEFNDIKSLCFSRAHRANLYSCEQCERKTSRVYNLAIFEPETGVHEESVVSVWQICTRELHVEKISEIHEHFILSELQLKSYDTLDSALYTKESMISDIEREAFQQRSIQRYFDRSHRVRVHAVGTVDLEDSGAFYKGYASPDHVINVHWRDMYFRKIIPSQFYESEGQIDKIIDQYRVEPPIYGGSR